MIEIELIDFKGDYWRLMWPGACSRYLHKAEAYYKAWWYVGEGPDELKNYPQIPLPIFTDWWI